MLESPGPAPDAQSGGSSVPIDGLGTVTLDPATSAALERPLSELAGVVRGATILGDPTVRVADVTYRSDEVRPGSLFFCVPGARTDGHAFAAAALASGAVALVVERALDLPVPQVVAPSVRGAMGPLSAVFFGRPADRLTLVGVTGTNGKTTTTYLLESIFRAAGMIPGVVGTTGVHIDGRAVPFDRTTPEAPDLQRLLARMAASNVDAVAMEVSSHGLDQHRVDGSRFACSVFTNLSQDHLDYHGTMEAYLAAKARLFTPELSERSALNGDTDEGRALAARSTIPSMTFGLHPESTLRATEVRVSGSGLDFRVEGIAVHSPLRGTFNVHNCLGAMAAAREVGIDLATAAVGIRRLGGVPGRVEAVDAGQAFPVLVDYAHTPDSLDNVLRAARALGHGKLIVVFGCGGDRDRGKRPLMGRVATSLADLTVVTSDNPRSEDPLAIIEEILAGAREGGGRFVVEADRRAAIHLGLAEAGPGDVVVIAGKGHETGQEFGDRTLPFDDRDVAADELHRLSGTAP